MLLRAALSIEDTSLADRLYRLLRQLDVWSDPVDFSALEPTTVIHAYDLILTGPSFQLEQIVTVLRSVQEADDPPAVIRLYEASDPKGQAILLGQGLADSVYLGVSDDRLYAALQTIADRRRADIEARLGPTPDEPQLRDFRSLCPSMQKFRTQAQVVARTDSTVLILGETGVGKEWLARAIHHESPRKDGPFVPVNCGALNETLLESELFGHDRGAFTGAETPRRGHFELAHGGTLFLDEIGEMPIHLQSRLLRVIEDRRVQRLGSERIVRVNVRIIAATHRNLREDVKTAKFRADLLYRLRVVQLTIPPLRERREDIPSLARFHSLAAAKRIGLPPVELSTDALECLKRYTWPGNIRELANVVERGVILSRQAPIEAEDLPEELRTPSVLDENFVSPEVNYTEEENQRNAISPLTEQIFRTQNIDETIWDQPWRRVRHHMLHETERFYLIRLLSHTHGRVGEAARKAGLSERGLFEKMKRHGLSKENFRVRRSN